MAVIFPDIELWVCQVLQAALIPHEAVVPYVGVATPSPRPARFITVRRDGGPVRDVALEDPLLAVTVWGKSEQDATGLALLVSALLRAAPDGVVTAVRQQLGPSPIADESKQPCRYMTFRITVKGAEL